MGFLIRIPGANNYDININTSHLNAENYNPDNSKSLYMMDDYEASMFDEYESY